MAAQSAGVAQICGEPLEKARPAGIIASMTAASEITSLLTAWRDGDGKALDQLIPVVYDELRSLAVRYMRKESGANTLQATA
ncbi:MAG TPA: ECF-type sigma factor, partial [Burkholderiales bacterium]|nr:ECF-type sigma factor [Burkholderiales bacterium]